jgi:8-hydroxy-5-deazaflavin:NADPH oxidoreductase
MAQAAVAVLGGTGHQGRGLAQRLALAGFQIVIGSRDAARAAATVAEWPAPLRPSSTAPYGEAIAAADIVVLAIPFESVAPVLEQHHALFRPETLVVDITVPITVAGGTLMLAEVPEGSAAEHVRARLPPTVGVAATFKTVPAALLADSGRALDCDEFVCGDSQDSRARAADLVRAIAGLRPIDIGPLPRSRSIEHLTLVAIAINKRHKTADARFRVVGV